METIIGVIIGGVIALLGQLASHLLQDRSRRRERIADFRLQALRDFVEAMTTCYELSQDIVRALNWLEGITDQVAELSAISARLRALAMLADESGRLHAAVLELLAPLASFVDHRTDQSAKPLLLQEFKDLHHATMIEVQQAIRRTSGT